jgi:hypothetical protein
MMRPSSDTIALMTAESDQLMADIGNKIKDMPTEQLVAMFIILSRLDSTPEVFNEYSTTMQKIIARLAMLGFGQAIVHAGLALQATENDSHD